MPLVNTLGQNLMIRGHLRKMQTDLGILEEQVSTGKKSQTFAGLGAPATRQVLDKRDMLARYEEYKETNQFVRSRTGHMDQVLTKIGETALEMRDKALKTGSSTDPSILKQNASAAIDSVINFVNTNLGGNYVFSGIDVTTVPFDDAATMTAAVTAALPALPATRAAIETAITTFFNTPANYYNGSATGFAPARVDDNRTVDYGILPNGTIGTENGGFAEVLSGLFMIALIDEADVTGGQNEHQQLLIDASQTLNSGAANVNILVGKNGDLHSLIETIQTQHEATTVLLETEVGEIEDADPYETIARLTQLQFQLEASYRTTAELRDLSLVKFL